MKEKIKEILEGHDWFMLNKHLWKPLGDWERIIRECLDNPRTRVSLTMNMDGNVEKITLKTKTKDCWGHEEIQKYHIFVTENVTREW